MCSKESKGLCQIQLGFGATLAEVTGLVSLKDFV